MDSVSKIVKKLRENRILNERTDYSNYSREELVTMAQEGDQLAVETLVNSHKDLISMMANKYFLGKDYDMEDMKQIATIGLWEAIMSWNKKGDFEAYAGMIIKRKFIAEMNTVNAEKRKSDQDAASLDEPTDGDDEGGESTLGDKLSTNVSTEEEFLGKEGAREIMNFLEKTLSDSEREVIKKYIQGYKVSQIVEETGMKYKSVENAIMRVKNKLSDYMRKSNNESKQEVDDTLEFSEDEKQVLRSVLDKIDENRRIKESAEVKRLMESYENYTEAQLDKELESIEEEIEEVARELEQTPWESDRYDELKDILDDMKHKLLAMEDYLTDAQFSIAEDLKDKIRQADNTKYQGDKAPTDPYAARGLRRSDFYPTK